ncbi:MAG TPA: hypothetical protein VFZ07_11000, partial [Dongiaceae bacterium]
MSHSPSSISADYQQNLSLISSIAGTVEFGLVERRKDLSMRLERCSLGPIDIFRYEGYGLRSATRSNREVHGSPSDDFLVLFPISKPIRLSQCRRDAIVKPGGLCLMSTGLPYEL